MNEPDDIPARVTRLEHEMIQARSDAAAARVLAGGADRDVSLMQDELRGHTRSLNALRETQVEHGQRIDRLERKVDDGFQQADVRFQQIDANFRQVDANFKTVGREFSKVNTGIAHITALLTNKVDEPDEE